jgi:hypothetical protein
MPDFEPISDTQRWSILRTKLAEKKIVEVFQMLRAAGIEPILIKGWDISRYYPHFGTRHFIDIDIGVAPDDFDSAKRLVDSAPFSYMNVDLHRGFRHLDTQPWDNLFENSELITIENTPVRILRAEDHLRIICVHWLTDGGDQKEKLRDVYYLIENRPKDFDWARCLDVVDTKRRRWIVCVIGLANKYFGLDLSDTPIENEAKKLPRWFVKTVEKEWKSDVRLVYLNDFSQNPLDILKQIRKRLPPNPIIATIDCDGDFDARTRIGYQIRDMFIRFKLRRARIKASNEKR